MKKVLFLLSVLLLLPSSAAPQVRPDDSIVTNSFTGDWDQIEKRRHLRILLPTNSTNYFIDKGKQQGISYDVFKQFEEQINKGKKRAKFHVVFLPTPRDQLLKRLLEGKGDVVAGNLTVTESRQKLVAFTQPVLTGVSEVLVTNKDGSDVFNVPSDLSGKRVSVRRGTSHEESIAELNETLRTAGKPPVKVELIAENLESEDILQMVNANLLPATIVDDYMADIWANVLPDIVIHKNIALRSHGEIAWATRPANAKLREVLNGFIATNDRVSKFGAVLFKKYFQNVKFVKNALGRDEIAKFEKLLYLFETRAKEYDVDPLLMMAEAYQESMLDHSARSRVGAIGIMQVMPKTGKELKVGDIRKVDANIHAGIKYISRLILEYFNEPQISPTDKVFFALAGYNAGPNRILRLRELAAKRGYDKNIWFDNVETVVLEKVGREPVQYVSNVSKYYLAYRMYLENERERQLATRAVTPGTVLSAN